MKKGVYFLIGTGAAMVLKRPLSWLVRETAIGAMRAKRNLSTAMQGVREDLEDIEAVAKSRDDARAQRRGDSTTPPKPTPGKSGS